MSNFGVSALLDYKKCNALAKSQPEKSGLLAVKQERHFSVSWHQFGRAWTTIERLLTAEVGKYDRNLDGIILTIGKYKAKEKKCQLINDQGVAHLNFNIKYIIFRPKVGFSYAAEITRIDAKAIIGKIYGVITIVAKIPRRKIQVGQIVRMCIQNVAVKGRICTLHGSVTYTRPLTDTTPSLSCTYEKSRPHIDTVLGGIKKQQAILAQYALFENEDEVADQPTT